MSILELYMDPVRGSITLKKNPGRESLLTMNSDSSLGSLHCKEMTEPGWVFYFNIVTRVVDPLHGDEKKCPGQMSPETQCMYSGRVFALLLRVCIWVDYLR